MQRTLVGVSQRDCQDRLTYLGWGAAHSPGTEKVEPKLCPPRESPASNPHGPGHWVASLKAHPARIRVLVPWFLGDGLSFLRGCCILAIGPELPERVTENEAA